MEQYSGFARVYDLFMDNVPYDKWAKYLNKLLKKSGVSAGGDIHPLVCELGCGTGSMTRRLKNFGYDMIGIDISEEMLQIAREQEADNDDSILYLLQDMREFELYGTVAAIVSVCDSMNYITDNKDMAEVFRLVNNYLDPNGVFIFDLNTPYYYKNVLGEQTICENRPEGSFIWENYYDRDSHINEFDMTIYYNGSLIESNDNKSVNERDGAAFYRCEETHYQKAYSISEIRRMLNKAGLEVEHVYDAFTTDEPNAKSERVYFVARTTKKGV